MFVYKWFTIDLYIYTHIYISIHRLLCSCCLPIVPQQITVSSHGKACQNTSIDTGAARPPVRAYASSYASLPKLDMRRVSHVTVSHVTRCCCTQARHARECAHEGAAHAEVPQGGDGFERKGRGVDLVIRLSEVRSAAHACTECHASKCAQQRACRGLSTVHPKPKNPMLIPKTPNLNPYLASPSSPPAAAPGRGSVRPAFTHAAAADTHAHHWTWPSAEPCARCCRRRCTAAQPWHQRWA